LAGIIPVGDDRCRFDYKKLESAIQAVIKNRLKDENALMADNSAGKVPTFVVATKGIRAEAPPTLFRSYQCEDHDASECTIWEAGRATSAAPTFFKPIQIGRGVFIDGGLAHNNPGELALSEAQKIWKTTQRFCLVSVGTGRLASIQVVSPESGSSTDNSKISKPNSAFAKTLELIPGIKAGKKVVNTPGGLSTLAAMGKACAELSTNSEQVHQRLLAKSQSRDPRQRFPYHRLNVDRGLEDIGLGEYKRINEIAMHTDAYLDERTDLKNACVKDLMKPAAMECK
jgi:patatin-like phospholipase/acyl hydrolase